MIGNDETGTPKSFNIVYHCVASRIIDIIGNYASLKQIYSSTNGVKLFFSDTFIRARISRSAFHSKKSETAHVNIGRVCENLATSSHRAKIFRVKFAWSLAFHQEM